MHWPISGPKQGPLSSMIGLKLAFVKNIRRTTIAIIYAINTVQVQVVLFQKHSFKSEKNQGKPKVLTKLSQAKQFDHHKQA